MSHIREWSTTAASNNSAPPDGFPEGMAPSGYNDAAREMMAQLKTWYLQSFRNYITGLRISNNGTNPTYAIDIAVGAAMDTTGVEILEQTTAALTKNINASWAVGDGNGGLDDGTVAADTVYAVWLIADVTNNVVDALFSTAFTLSSVSLPTNYTLAQLIGAVCTDGSSNILDFRQRGDYFQYDVPITDLSGQAIADSSTANTPVSAPPDCLWVGTVHLENSTEDVGDQTVWLWTAGEAAHASNDDFCALKVDLNSGFMDAIAVSTQALISPGGQLSYAGSESNNGATMSITTKAFQMFTRGAAS